MRDLIQYSSRGIPILSLPEKVEALRECLESGSHEDAMGHLFDLMAHCQAELRESTRQDDLAVGGDARSQFLAAIGNWDDASLT